MSFESVYTKEVSYTNGRGATGTRRELNTVKLAIHLIGSVVALILILSLNPFNSVPTGSRGVVTQFGKIVRIENEGLVLLPPWQKLALFNIRAEKADIDNADGSTSDTQPVHVSLTVRYSISTDKVSQVYEQYSHNGDLSSYVQTATQEVFKAVTARYTAPDLIAQRAKVSADINSALGVKLAKYGAAVINIDMRNFAFQESYMRAINSKVEQEQLRLAAENKLLTVVAEQKQKVAVAEAEASAVKAKADGDAYATIAQAKANGEETRIAADSEAHALSVQQQAVAAAPQVLELRRIQVEQTKAEKWNGALPENMYGSAPLPFLNAPVNTK
jgi:regulator of protease activity HflC (stomatin/prohibitin superfamily)